MKVDQVMAFNHLILNVSLIIFVVCTYRYLSSTYKQSTRGDLEAYEVARQQWANSTDGPCKDGEGDHCMPFCGKYIANYYPPCVPVPAALEEDINFPHGRHHNHTTRTKDRWVEEKVLSLISRRIEIETNKTAKKLGVDEHGNKGKSTKVRFNKNKACQVVL